MQILIIISAICFSGFAQNIDPSERLFNATIQIRSKKGIIENGIKKMQQVTGTGFYFTYEYGGKKIPVIITNRHVVEGMAEQILSFKLTRSDGNPDYRHIEQLNLKKNDMKWIFHPDANVDLAILAIDPILKYYDGFNKKIFYAPFDERLIPSDSIKNTLIAIEDILMVGYPCGLRDISNDLPIVRRGITATPFYLDYNRKKEFLCDVPVYPGSSGSPIVIFNQQAYTDRKGTITLCKRELLLGINYATYTKNFECKLISSKTLLEPSTLSVALPYNIAVVIKSERILDFKQILFNSK